MFSLVKLRSSVSMSGPSATAKPISAKISVHFVEHLADRMDAALRSRHQARTGSVTSARSLASRSSKRRSLERRLARLERLGDFGLQRVDGRAERLALLRRQLAELRHQIGNAALLAEGRRARPRAPPRSPALGDVLQHVGFEAGEV